jgi:hypothetical protein
MHAAHACVPYPILCQFRAPIILNVVPPIRCILVSVCSLFVLRRHAARFSLINPAHPSNLLFHPARFLCRWGYSPLRRPKMDPQPSHPSLSVGTIITKCIVCAGAWHWLSLPPCKSAFVPLLLPCISVHLQNCIWLHVLVHCNLKNRMFWASSSCVATGCARTAHQLLAGGLVLLRRPGVSFRHEHVPRRFPSVNCQHIYLASVKPLPVLCVPFVSQGKKLPLSASCLDTSNPLPSSQSAHTPPVLIDLMIPPFSLLSPPVLTQSNRPSWLNPFPLFSGLKGLIPFVRWQTPLSFFGAPGCYLTAAVFPPARALHIGGCTSAKLILLFVGRRADHNV